MKKVLVFCLLTVFSAFYAVSAWGAVYNWSSGDVTVYFNSSNNTLTVSGNGDMADYSSGGVNSKWGTHSASATTLVVEEGVTHIGAYAFQGFSALTTVTIPASVTSIGASAFTGCTHTTRINASTPNNWASISFANAWSTPFGATGANDDVKAARSFYFYGSNSATTELYFTPGLTCINQYAFYNVATIQRVCVPATVSEIQSYALNCHMLYFVTLRTDAMTLGSDKPITFKTGVASYLYLPVGANNDYKTNSTFYDGNTSTELGASKIGYSSTDKGATTWGSGNYVYPLSGTTGGLNWEIIQNTGTLRIYGSGYASSVFTDGSSSLPWYRFKLLIDRVEIEGIGGTVHHIYNNIKFFPALREIQIIQSTMPDINSDGINASLKHNEGIYVIIPGSILIDASVSDLGDSPWNDARLTIVTAISDGDDNETALNNLITYVNRPMNIQLGRNFAAHPQYNTFCAPFSMTNEQLEAVFGAGYDLEEFTGASMEGEELTLTFTNRTALEAGKPYLIMPNAIVNNPTFEGVTVSTTGTTDETSTLIDFKGVLVPTVLEGGNKNLLFLGADNELLWPASTGNLNSFRAYFAVKGDARRAIRARMSMDGHNSPTNLESVQPSAISSQKVLRDGKLYIMHNGQMYDVQGRRVQ